MEKKKIKEKRKQHEKATPLKSEGLKYTKTENKECNFSLKNFFCCCFFLI